MAGRRRAAAGAVVPAHGLEHRRGARRDRTLFAGVEDERFYFVHSYGVRDWTLETNDRTRAPLVTWAEHGGDRFVAAVENGPLVRDPVPPGEVRRRRRRAAAQLGGDAVMSKERARRREPSASGEAAVAAAARAAEAERAAAPRRPGAQARDRLAARERTRGRPASLAERRRRADAAPPCRRAGRAQRRWSGRVPRRLGASALLALIAQPAGRPDRCTLMLFRPTTESRPA